MSGGGATAQQPTPAAGPSGFSGPSYQMTAQPFMPGQLDAFARALSGGYGGGEGQMSYLKSIFAPTTFRGFQPIPGMMASAPPPVAAPAAAPQGAPPQASGGFLPLPFGQGPNGFGGPGAGYGGKIFLGNMIPGAEK